MSPRKKATCFRCGLSDHTSAACPKNKSNIISVKKGPISSQKAKKCTDCGKTNNRLKTCVKRMEGCTLCNKLEHTSRDLSLSSNNNGPQNVNNKQTSAFDLHSKECSPNIIKSSKERSRCTYCGLLNHTSITCSKKKKNIKHVKASFKNSQKSVAYTDCSFSFSNDIESQITNKVPTSPANTEISITSSTISKTQDESTLSTKVSKKCTVCHIEGHNFQTCTKKNSQLKHQLRRSHRKVNKAGNSKGENDNSNNYQKREKCSGCGKRDHSLEICPMTIDCCSLCHNFGHISGDCNFKYYINIPSPTTTNTGLNNTNVQSVIPSCVIPNMEGNLTVQSKVKKTCSKDSVQGQKLVTCSINTPKYKSNKNLLKSTNTHSKSLVTSNSPEDNKKNEALNKEYKQLNICHKRIPICRLNCRARLDVCDNYSRPPCNTVINELTDEEGNLYEHDSTNKETTRIPHDNRHKPDSANSETTLIASDSPCTKVDFKNSTKRRQSCTECRSLEHNTRTCPEKKKRLQQTLRKSKRKPKSLFDLTWQPGRCSNKSPGFNVSNKSFEATVGILREVNSHDGRNAQQLRIASTGRVQDEISSSDDDSIPEPSRQLPRQLPKYVVTRNICKTSGSNTHYLKPADLPNIPHSSTVLVDYNSSDSEDSDALISEALAASSLMNPHGSNVVLPTPVRDHTSLVIQPPIFQHGINRDTSNVTMSSDSCTTVNNTTSKVVQLPDNTTPLTVTSKSQFANSFNSQDCCILPGAILDTESMLTEEMFDRSHGTLKCDLYEESSNMHASEIFTAIPPTITHDPINAFANTPYLMPPTEPNNYGSEISNCAHESQHDFNYNSSNVEMHWCVKTNENNDTLNAFEMQNTTDSVCYTTQFPTNFTFLDDPILPNVIYDNDSIEYDEPLNTSSESLHYDSTDMEDNAIFTSAIPTTTNIVNDIVDITPAIASLSENNTNANDSITVHCHDNLDKAMFCYDSDIIHDHCEIDILEDSNMSMTVNYAESSQTPDLTSEVLCQEIENMSISHESVASVTPVVSHSTITQNEFVNNDATTLQISNSDEEIEQMSISNESIVPIFRDLSTEQKNHVEKDTSRVSNHTRAKKCGSCGKEGHNKATCRKKRTRKKNNTITEEINIEDTPDNLRNNDVSSNLMCTCCCRESTAYYQLNFKALNIPFVKRKYGNTSALQEGDTVCGLCFRYLDQNNSNANWKDAWPSFLYTCLTKRNFVTDAIPFMNLFTKSLRSMYSRGCKTKMIPEIQNLWKANQKFKDVTNDLKHFKKCIAKYKLGVLRFILNKTSFPDVRCPMGCYLYMDGKIGEDIALLPAQHYLTKCIKNLKSFDANDAHVLGFRPDYPNPIKELNKFVVSPSIIIDEEYGLSLMMCGPKRHCDATHAFIHPPVHPFLSLAPQHPDTLAPVVLSPNLVQAGKVNSKNASYAVLSQKASRAGMSTFKLALHYLHSLIESDEELLSLGLSLDQRQDIREALYSMAHLQMFHKHWVDYQIEHFNMHKDEHKREIEDASKTGTFVTLTDSVELSKVGGQASEALDHKVSNAIQIVHPSNNKIGRKSYNIPRFKSRKHQESQVGCIIQLIISAILHCRPLQNSFRKSLQDSETKELKTLYKTCLSISTGTARIDQSEIIALENSFVEQVIQENDHLQLHSDIHVLASHILSKISNIDLVNLDENYTIEDKLNAFDKITIFETSSVETFVPLNSQDQNWQLLFCGNVKMSEVSTLSDVHVLHRWNQHFEWQSQINGSCQLPINNPQVDLFTLFIYASKSAIDCIDDAHYINLSGGQTMLRCAHHKNSLMLKVSPAASLLCSYDDCTRAIKWRCSFGLGYPNFCRTGICMKHAKLLWAQESCEPIRRRNREDTIDIHETSFSSSSSEEDLTMGDESSEEEPEDVSADRYIGGDPSDYGGLPQVTAPTVPSYVENIEPNTSTSGHFFLNDNLRCMYRNNLRRNSPLALQQLLQHIHSVCPKNTFPLMFPEALLHPTIFWMSQDGSPVGAIPHALYGPLGRTKRKGGFATLIDHIRVRVYDGGLLTSKSLNYISWAFDVILNQFLSTHSIEIALRRGLENINQSFLTPEAQESKLAFDEIESRRKLNELSAMIRENPWTYFMTITCNDEETMGVAPIRQAILKLYEYFPEEVNHCMQNYASIMTSAFHRTIRYFLDYLLNSDEKILGDVIQYWVRFEFQSDGALGNKPHVHAGLTLNPDTLNDPSVNERIVNRVCDMWSPYQGTDYDSLMVNNLIDDWDDFIHLQMLAEDLQNHICSKGNGRCQKKTKSGAYACRVPQHRSDTQYWEETLNLFSNETLLELLNLDLAHLDYWGNIVPNEILSSKVYHYPSESNEVRVPTVPMLFVAFRSVTNVQRCTSHTIGYVTKYCSGKECRANTCVLTLSKDASSITLQKEKIVNEKIAGANVAQKQSKFHLSEPYCREIGTTEMLFFTQGLEYILTNVNFVHASTHSPEMRSGVKRPSSNCISKVIDEEGRLTPVIARHDMPEHRQFTRNQKTLIFEHGTGKYHLDHTSAFSLRPPELLIIRSLEQYLKWFVRRPASKYLVHPAITECPWMDGACYRVLIRRRYVKDLFEYLSSIAKGADPDASAKARELLQVVDRINSENNSTNTEYSLIFKRFVAVDDNKDTMVVFTSVTPERFDKWIYHALLTMGSFDTELDFKGLTAVQSLIMSKVATDDQFQNIKLIAKHYVLDQLAYLPLTARKFSTILRSLTTGLTNLFNNRLTITDTMPLVTYRSIQESATAKLEAHQKSKLTTLVNTLHKLNIPGFPDKELLIERKYAPFEPQVTRLVGQSDNSFKEQTFVLHKCVTEIDNLTNPNCTTVRFPLIIGSPGVGKSHILLLCCTYALGKTLRTMLVSTTSERARQLGGEHMHLLFGLPVSQSKLESTDCLVDKCIHNLTLSPIKQAFLKSLDVLIFEEIGLLSSRMYVVLDLVLRLIRQCQRPFGGILLIASGDHRQLRPIDGRGIWLSTSLTTHFAIFILSHFVRSRQDEDLQEIIRILRQVDIRPTDVKKFFKILNQRIRSQQFLQDWNQVASNVLRVVGKREAVAEVTQMFLDKRILNCTDKQYIRSTAIDEVESLPNQWTSAAQTTSNRLTRCCRERRELLIFENAIMRLTYNDSSNTHPFSQGQLCTIDKLPDIDLPLSEQRIEVRLVPPGVRDINVDNIPDSWPRIKLKLRYTMPIVIGRGGTKGRRYQWPLDYFVCTTVHKVIGETLPKIATKISICNSKYALWEREQLLVILSRVSSLSDILFVGNKRDTFLAIQQLLLSSDPVTEFIHNTLTSINRVQPGSGLIKALYRSTLTSNESDVPADNAGFVYMAISQNYPENFILKQCVNIRKDLHTLNQSLLSDNNSLRPWILVLFITGFEADGQSAANKEDRESLLEFWNLCEPGDKFGKDLMKLRYHQAKTVHLEFKTMRGVPFNNLILKYCINIC